MEFLLGYNISSDTVLNIGVTLMKIVFLLTAAVFVQVIILRTLLVFREYRRNKFIDMWRPILMESMAIAPEKLPKLNYNLINDFISEWNSLYEKLGGISHDNLIGIADRLNIHHFAMYMLISSHQKIQLTGIITLGNMRATCAWEVLTSISKSDQTILSMAAYRALILINSDRALEELLPTLLKREDWPLSMVARILKNTDPIKVCDLIAETCKSANDKQLANLIQYLNTLNCMCAHELFRNILSQNYHNDHIISLCLAELNDPLSIEYVRKFVTHPRWHVRAHAATALGNIGAKSDFLLLEKLINDKQWWVRYRAAQAITKMPFISKEDVIELQRRQYIKPAKQILDQVLAEQELK